MEESICKVINHYYNKFLIATMRRFFFPHLDLDEISDLFLQGSVVVYPTDTIAGIGCIGTSEEAVKRIYKIKKRSRKKSVSFAFSSIGQINKYAKIPSQALKLLPLLPGPLSLILPLRKNAPKLFGLYEKTICVRIPDVKWLLKLINKINIPIITTSANISDHPAPNNIAELDKKIMQQIDVLIEWQGNLSGIASTIVSTIEKIKIIREGSIPSNKILSLI